MAEYAYMMCFFRKTQSVLCNVFVPVRLEEKIKMVENRQQHISEAFVFEVLKALLRSCVSITMFHPAAVKLYLHGLISSSLVKEISTAFSDMDPNLISKGMI